MEQKADADVKRQMQIEALKHDLSKAKTLREYAWVAIQNGCDPAYVAMRYGFTVEEMQRAKEIHEQREKEKQERATRGNES